MIVPALALLLSVVGAAVVSAPPDATITAAPELKKRVSYVTLGWYSSTEIFGTVDWDYIEYDADSTTYFTSGNFYRRCLKGRESLCPMYTSCSSGYMLAATTSTFCGQYISICSWNVMYSSYGGSNPKTGLWCDDPTYTGDTLYATSPGTIRGSGATTPSITRLFTSTDESTSSEESSTSTPTPTTIDSSSSGGTVPPFPASTTSAEPSPSKGGGDGSKKAGIIAGATIGGIALLGAIVVAIIFILRRTRRDPVPPQQYMPQPPMGQPPAAIASMPEKQPMANAAPMQPMYQQPGMDPRNSNYYGQGSMSPQPTGQQLPQYPGYNSNMNEMPTVHRG